MKLKQALLDELANIGRQAREKHKPRLRQLWLDLSRATDLRFARGHFGLAALQIGGPEGVQLRTLALKIPLDEPDPEVG